MNPGITVVGLGSGDEQQLTLGILRKLESASRLYLRTERHPVAAWLAGQGIRYETFDRLYEEADSFPEVYEAIVRELLAQAKQSAEEGGGDIVYAVPGHPSVAERTVVLLKERCAESGVTLEVMGGESFLDQAFARFGFDPIEGFQLLDASGLSFYQLNPSLHLIIAQIYDVFTASDAKLALMERYPDDYPVYVGHNLGIAGEERIMTIPLYELDRVEGYGNRSLVWVPATREERVLNRGFDRLHEIVRILRSPEGCPWDREQTHQSIRKNLIEETYEVLETIDEDDPDHMCEELGDLLLQVMLHAQMEEEVGTFTVYDVIERLNEKLVRRHPHVFGSAGAENAQEALANWDAMKAEEKRKQGQDPGQISVLSGIPRDLPALMTAYKMQKKAAKVGFDWDHIGDVFAKVAEELDELRRAAQTESTERKQEELGDLLFAVVNLARFVGADPEEALSLANRKFAKRFAYVEEQFRVRGKALQPGNLDEMEQLWQEAKKRGL